jgi:hypothetical protein
MATVKKNALYVSSALTYLPYVLGLSSQEENKFYFWFYATWERRMVLFDTSSFWGIEKQRVKKTGLAQFRN